MFHRTGTSNSEICMETKKTPKSQTILRKNSKTKGIMHPDFKLYYKATSLQYSMMLAQKQINGSME